MKQNKLHKYGYCYHLERLNGIWGTFKLELNSQFKPIQILLSLINIREFGN